MDTTFCVLATYNDIAKAIVSKYGSSSPACYLATSNCAVWVELCSMNVPPPRSANFYTQAFLSESVGARHIQALCECVDMSALASKISRKTHFKTMVQLMNQLNVDKAVLYSVLFNQTITTGVGRAVFSGDLGKVAMMIRERKIRDIESTDIVQALCMLIDATMFFDMTDVLDELLDTNAWRQISLFLVRRSDTRAGEAFHQALCRAWSKSGPSIRVIIKFIDTALRCGGHDVLIAAIMNQVEQVGGELMRHTMSASMYYDARQDTIAFMYKRFYGKAFSETTNKFLIRALVYQSREAMCVFIREVAEHRANGSALHIESQDLVNGIIDAACKNACQKWKPEEWAHWVSHTIRTFGIHGVCAHHRLQVATFICEMGWREEKNGPAIDALFALFDAYSQVELHDVYCFSEKPTGTHQVSTLDEEER